MAEDFSGGWATLLRAKTVHQLGARILLPCFGALLLLAPSSKASACAPREGSFCNAVSSLPSLAGGSESPDHWPMARG